MIRPRPTQFLCSLGVAALLLPLAGCRHSNFPDYPEGFREFAYVANSAGNTVTVLDLVYFRVDRTLQVGVKPVALAANPLRNEVYALNEQPATAAGSLSIIDTLRNQVVASIPLHRGPTFLSVDPTGRRAFVANTGANTVSVIDLDARRTTASAPTGDKPDSAVISPDGRTLVVTNHGSGSVSVFSAGAPGSAAPALALRSTYTGCPGATSAVILPDSSKTFIACSSGHQVLSIGLAAAPDSWAARQDPSLLTDHLLAFLDTGVNPTNLTLKPDGGEVFVSNNTADTISEISTQTNEVGSTYPIGNHPAHGIVSQDNSALWVSNSGADSVSLYSIDDGKLLSSLRTGNAPDALAFSGDEQQTFLLAADKSSGDVAIIRTTGKLGPALFTILPAGGSPTAIVTKAMHKP